MGWWFFTRSALEGLTRPKADIAACDRDVERLAHDSRLGALLHDVSRSIDAAAANSMMRKSVVSLAAVLSPSTMTGWRMGGWIAVVSGLTILGLDAIKPTPIGPLSWLLPSIIVIAGLLTMMLAGPLARAADDRRTRHATR